MPRLFDLTQQLENNLFRVQMRYQDLASRLGLDPERGKRTVISTVSALKGKGWIAKVTASRHYPTVFLLTVPNPELVIAEKEWGILDFLSDEDQSKFELMVQFLERPGNTKEYEDVKQRAYDWLQSRGAVNPENLADRIAENIVSSYLPGARDRYGWYFDRLLSSPIPPRQEYLQNQGMIEA